MPSAADLLRSARDPSSRSGRTISTAELREAYNEAKRPQAGDPAGKPLTVEEAALFTALNTAELTSYARRYVLPGLLAEIPSLVQSNNQGGVKVLPELRGRQVFLSTAAGFAADAAGAAPASLPELISTLNNAGRYMQAGFGSSDNLFKSAQLDNAGKKAVLAQLKGALANTAQLTEPQKEQLMGSVGALAAELLKSIEFVPMSPTANAELLALRDEAFGLLTGALDDPRMSVLVERGLVGYVAQSDTFQAKLTAAQKADLVTRHDALFPTKPADYARWETAGKNRIVIDHVSGGGENFVFGFVKQLTDQGVNSRSSSSPKFTLVSGDPKYGPAVLEAKIPANSPLNQWGREMTLEVRVREMGSAVMYRGMGDAGVDIVSYGGHSNFGNNTLNSLRNAPAQNGDKIVLRDLCAGADTKNAEAHRYPEASLNAITSVGSSYFRTTNDPVMGKYANESEGFDALMSTVRGLLGKKDWKAIGTDLAERANWYGHDSDNNWTHPGDPRAGAWVDSDKDGVPNVFDLMPGYDTTDIAASTALEFDLRAPTLRADLIDGTRVFQAIQFANTAAAYNSSLHSPNSERRMVVDPTGIFFDAKDAPNEYVKFRRGPKGEHLVQVSSALADMSIESLRAVMFFELAKHLGRENPSLYPNDATANAMGLVFASAALQYDQSWRDQEIFDGLKRLYGIPASVTLAAVEKERADADNNRHNYTGDLTAARNLATANAGLGGATVGKPAVPVTIA